jgi:hypothetical protein
MWGVRPGHGGGSSSAHEEEVRDWGWHVLGQSSETEPRGVPNSEQRAGFVLSHVTFWRTGEFKKI